ncbi:MAG: phosphate regulon sensor histidine kinase PhoR [Pseudomonadota bacterium]
MQSDRGTTVIVSTTKKRSSAAMGSSKEFAIPLVLVGIALLFGLWTGELGWCLFVASLVWIWVQAIEYRKVRKWSQRPLRKPRNGLDSWFALAYAPFRSLKRERQRTQRMAFRLRQILGLSEVVPDGVIILGPNGEMEGLNTAAKQMLQLNDSDLGLSLASVVRSPDFVAFLRAADNDEPLEFVSPFDPNVSFEARRINVDTGRVIVLIRDITALNRLLTMRQSFVANVSHELRTPLTVMAGYLETLEDPDQDEQLKLELLPRLNSPVRRMQSLVDDLLLLTQLESNPLTEHRAPVNMRRVIEGAVYELQGLLASDDQITVRCNTEQSVFGVETELHSVCVNLLSNAVRYSPKGSQIDISWCAMDGACRLAVKDGGVGIAPEHISRLTERFYRVDMAGARAKGGTGLGLAIVKHILRRHNSELQVESQLGVGSLFYCDFEPYDPDADPDAKRGHEPSLSTEENGTETTIPSSATQVH